MWFRSRKKVFAFLHLEWLKPFQRSMLFACKLKRVFFCAGPWFISFLSCVQQNTNEIAFNFTDILLDTVYYNDRCLQSNGGINNEKLNGLGFVGLMHKVKCFDRRQQKFCGKKVASLQSQLEKIATLAKIWAVPKFCQTYKKGTKSPLQSKSF